MFVSMCDGECVAVWDSVCVAVRKECVAVWDSVCVAVRKEYLAIRFAVGDSEL